MPALAAAGTAVPPAPWQADAAASTLSLLGELRGPDGVPLAGATVVLLSSARTTLEQTTTDETGGFEFDGLQPGTYVLRSIGTQFGEQERVVELVVNMDRVDLALRQAGFEERITVTASRGSVREATRVPATVRSLPKAALLLRAADLLPRMLDEEPGVLTQQTTPGQGSPVLRGQSAQAVLYLIDGIRFNNSTYRGGNTQYLAWVPDVAVESVEILLGPAGVNYGSDALGGAINVLTASLSGFSAPGASPRVNGSVRAYGELASQGAGSNATLGIAGSHFAGYAAINGARHQNLRSGRGFDSHNVLVRFLGFDREQLQTALGSRNRDTSYSQGGVTLKGAWRLGPTSTLSGFFVRSGQSGVRRYDRLLGGEGRFRADFTPQRLEFGYLRYQTVISGTILESTVSVNRQTDGRLDQNRPFDVLQTELSVVTATGLEVMATKTAGEHILTAGMEVYDERVDASRTFSLDGVTNPVRPRFPDDSRYTSLGLFLLDELSVGRLNISGGARYSRFRYKADASKNIINGIVVVPSSTETFDDITMNLGATLLIGDQATGYARVTRGFRAPSIFDLSELGLTGGGFEISPDSAITLGSQIGNSSGPDAVTTGLVWQPLEPEVLWSFEGGFRWSADDLQIEIASFNNDLYNALSRRAVIVSADVVGTDVGEPIVAQDELGRIFVSSSPDPVVSRANIGRVRVWGLEATVRKAWGARWGGILKAALQRGNELDTGNFARKISPDNVTATLRWNAPTGRLWLEGVLRGARRQSRLNPADIRDPRVGAFRETEDIADFFAVDGPRLDLVADGILLATGETLDEVIARVLGDDVDGRALFTSTPGWVSLGIRGGYTVAEGHQLLFVLSNLTDRNYRMHGSGIDAAGFNVNIAYSIDF